MKEILHSKPWITKEDCDAVENILSSGMIGCGKIVEEFEEAVAKRVGSPCSGTAVGSGSAAILLALQVLGCKKGKEVILPSYTCHTVLQAVLASGATPVLCDVGENWLIEPQNVEPLITSQTAAMIIPHVYGFYADVKAFCSFKIPIIEDCAQAFGRNFIFGDIAIFSFQPTKCLTTGEGGMAVSANEKTATLLRKLARDSEESFLQRTCLAPMSDISAALGLSQLSRYDLILEKRRVMADRYLQLLQKKLPDSVAHFQKLDSMYFRFPLKIEGGLDRYAAAFEKRHICVRRGVDHLLHRMQGVSDEKFPNAVHHFNHTLSLPIYPALTDNELEHCLQTLSDVFSLKID